MNVIPLYVSYPHQPWLHVNPTRTQRLGRSWATSGNIVSILSDPASHPSFAWHSNRCQIPTHDSTHTSLQVCVTLPKGLFGLILPSISLYPSIYKNLGNVNADISSTVSLRPRSLSISLATNMDVDPEIVKTLAVQGTAVNMVAGALCAVYL